MGHRLLALVEAKVLAVVPFCRHELVRVLVARQPGCHTLRILSVADVYWTSAEDRVSLCHPFLCMRVGCILPFLHHGGRVERILPFLHLGGRVERMIPVLGFVPGRLGLWDGVVTRKEADRRDRPVGPHCQLPVQ